MKTENYRDLENWFGQEVADTVSKLEEEKHGVFLKMGSNSAVVHIGDEVWKVYKPSIDDRILKRYQRITNEVRRYLRGKDITLPTRETPKKFKWQDVVPIKDVRRIGSCYIASSKYISGDTLLSSRDGTHSIYGFLTSISSELQQAFNESALSIEPGNVKVTRSGLVLTDVCANVELLGR